MKRQIESTQREIFHLELRFTKVPNSITGLNGNTHADQAAADAALSVGDDLKQYVSGPASNKVVSCKAKLQDGDSSLWIDEDGIFLRRMFYEIVLKTPFGQDPIVIGTSQDGRDLDIPRGRGSSSDPLIIDAIQGQRQDLLVIGSKVADKY
tara:strand:- start:164 stop:616 length:453 start_codon:yes stop_codon:yes gene_type:complete